MDIDGAVNMATTALVTGVLTTTAATVHTNGITMPDSAKAIFGAGDDLQIYHDGSDSYIDDAGAGALAIRSNSINLQKYTGETMAVFTADGAVELRYDNAAKIATASGGVTVTGEMAATTMDLSSNAVIDGTALVTGVLTTTAATVFNGGFASNAASTITTTGNGGLEIISTDQDANVGPNLDLYRNPGQAGADGDLIGQLNFYGLNDASEKTHYLYLNAKMNDVANGSEDVRWALNGIVNGADSSFMEYTQGTTATGADPELVFNQSSRDIDFRVESNGNDSMIFVDAGNDRVGIGTGSPSDYNSSLNTLVVAASGDSGVTLVSGTSSEGSIAFADGTSGADAYRGWINYNHGTNFMRFFTNATEAMRIHHTGAVTKSLQPAFQAFPTSAQTDIAINTAVTIVLGTEGFDLGANFASNTFTAPVTGKYQLNVVLSAGQLDIDATFYQLQLVTSNKSFDQTLDPLFSSDTAYWSWSFSVLADMDEDDTAVIKLYQAAGAAQADIGTGTTFSGYLVA